MRRSTWFTLGAGAILAVACGGNVKLGDTGSGLGASSSSGGSGTGKACAVDGACGPALGAPAIQCWDGSIGGNTGKCLDNGNGTCSWEMRDCPPDPGPAACFDAKGELDPSYRKCNTTADCQSFVSQSDCCGSQRAYGVSSSQYDAAKTCAESRAKGFPACDCASKPNTADDGSVDPGGASPSVTCNTTTSLCETSYKTTACGKNQCNAAQTCCDGIPFTEPTCVNGTMCPISQRKHKKDITYLSEADRQQLSDELLGFRLATYRYKSQGEGEREHLGFIIDDVAPSPAVVASGERVDMYGYATMAVATLQTQAREIAELRREVEDLKAALRETKRDTTKKK